MYRLLMIGVLLLAFWLRVADLDVYPPGISDDEAVNVIDAFHISQGFAHPLYEDPNRPEPLYRFALSTGTLFGQSVWAYRMVSALIGTFTVAAAGWAALEYAYPLSKHKRQLVALAAMGVLAVALSHITLSRALYRGLLQPTFMLLFAALLMRGLRTWRWRDFVLSGVCLAGAMYSYTSALVLPGALVAVGLSLLIFQRKAWRLWLPRLTVTGVVLVALFSFVIFLFIQNPTMIIGRAAELREGEGSLFSIERIQGLVNHFFVYGDDNPQYNTDSVPLLPPIFNVLFVVGVLALIVRFRQPSSALIAAMFIASALPEMATFEIPHGLRVAGQFAVFPLVVGAGVGALLVLLERRLVDATRGLSPLPLRRIMTAAVVLLIVGSAVLAWRVYVNYWDKPLTWRMFDQTMPIADWFFRTDRKAFSEWLLEQDTPILLPVDELNTKTTRVWLIQRYPNVHAGSVDIALDTQVVIPYRLELNGLMSEARQYAYLEGDTITILPPFDDATYTAITAGLDNRETLAALLPVNIDTPDYQPETITYQPPMSFADELFLHGVRGPLTLQGSESSISYTLAWSPARPLGREYSTFVQLLTQDQQFVAGDDVRVWRWSFPSTLWQSTDIVPDAHLLTLPDSLPPGAYRLVTGVYPGLFPAERLPAFGVDGTPLGDSALLDWVKVPQTEPPTIPENALTYDATLGERFALRAANAQTLDDGRIQLDLYWEALVERPDVDATIFVHVVGPDGENIAQDDSRPMGGQYPTFIWSAGEIVQTQHLLSIAEANDAQVYIGMYTFPNLTRLTAIQSSELTADGRLNIGNVGELLQQ